MVVFRKELKYDINNGQSQFIQNILEKVIPKDKNSNKSGKYNIKTIYFDNYLNSIENAKKDDINAVSKYRIRMYEKDINAIFLETKTNENGYINKEKEKITKEDVENILNGKYKKILDEQSKLKTKFYIEIILRHLRPILLVEYDRIAYVDNFSKTRITIDQNIISTKKCENFFSKECRKNNNKQILEIKYEKYIPDYIKNIIVNVQEKKIRKSKFITEIEKYKSRG